MREPVFRRCGTCGRRVSLRMRRCGCGAPAESISWYFTAELPKVEGRRRQVLRGGFTSSEDARKARADLLDEHRRPEKGTEPQWPELETTLGDYLQRWLERVRPPYLEETTYAEYVRKVRLHVLRYDIADRALRDLEAADFDRHYGVLGEPGSRADGREGGLSPKSVREVHQVLHKAFEDAVKAQRIPRNPLSGSHPPSQRMANARKMLDRRVWNAEQLAEFLEHTRGHRLSGVWMLAANTGMRRSEVLGALWSDVSLTAGRISVRQRLASVNGTPRLSVPKSVRSLRVIDLDELTVAALADLRAQQMSLAEEFGGLYWDWNFVAAHDDGHWVHPDYLSEQFRQLVEAARLPRIPLKNLRHTHATLLLEAGVNPKVVSERLGHHSVAFTLETYSYVLPSMQAEALRHITSIQQRRHQVTDGSLKRTTSDQ